MRALVAWSSGKDSAFALHAIWDQVEVVGLITTVTREFGRVSMHGVREELLEAQASTLQLPLTKVFIPPACSNATYEAQMRAALEAGKDAGVEAVVFGDLFLEDIRRYREAQLLPLALEPIFPLWLRDTRALAEEMISSGFRAHLTCVDPRKLPAAFAGRTFDCALLDALPSGVDPCGENGEFHTFVSNAPRFSAPIPVESGEVVERDGFVFADVNPRA